MHHSLLRAQQNAESIASRLRSAWCQTAHRLSLRAEEAATGLESNNAQYTKALFPEPTLIQDTELTI